jgi:hypothetical protein
MYIYEIKAKLFDSATRYESDSAEACQIIEICAVNSMPTNAVNVHSAFSLQSSNLQMPAAAAACMAA